MRVFVTTCCKAYENREGGVWFDLDDFESKEKFLDACRLIHSDEEEPEFFYSKKECDNDLEELMYGEYCISSEYWEYKKELKRCGVDAFVVALAIQYVFPNLDSITTAIQMTADHYRGPYDSEEEYEKEMAEKSGILNGLPDVIVDAIDWKQVSHFDDMTQFVIRQGKVHAFMMGV